jgi:hypothetical protein
LTIRPTAEVEDGFRVGERSGAYVVGIVEITLHKAEKSVPPIKGKQLRFADEPAE